MKRSTPSLDEAICIAATTGARVRAVFTFNLACLGGEPDGASLRLLAAAEAGCQHPAEAIAPHDEMGVFIVTGSADLIEELCRQPAVTTASLYRPDGELAPPQSAPTNVMAAA